VRRPIAEAAFALPSLLAAVMVLHACGGGGGAPPDPVPFGLTVRMPLGSALTFPAQAPNPLPLTPVAAFPNLTFTRPVFLGHAPDGTDRVFVVEQGGRVLVFPNRANVVPGEVSVFLDLSAAAGGPVSRASNEEGLLGLAFDPDYATTRELYVHYSAAGPRRSVLARYRAQAGNPSAVDLASAQEVLTVAQPYSNHNAGWLGFGQDGYLYMPLGDGGDAGDPQNRAQDMNELLGKILRLDVRGRATYAVPPDNPFVGQAGARGEIWSAGWRNPWRASFDRATGELWVGDVGQVTREEINRVVRGGNYGWRVREGNLNFDTSIVPQGVTFLPPAIDYGRSLGATVIGGVVYRGPTLTSLRGAYLYGDYSQGRVWALVHDGASVVSNTQVATVASLSSFGEDRTGEVFAVSLDGPIYRFTQTGSPPGPPVPARLSDTGLFTDVVALTPHAGLIEYDVNSPLWSDGALKRRWIAVPDAQRITFSSSGPWTFPLRTVLVKHFELELEPGNAASRTRLETRVLVRETTGWAGYTYRWNAAQTDADLLADGATADYVIQDPGAPGGQRTLTWQFPSRSDCLRCHTVPAGSILGVRSGQLNRDRDYGAVTDNQLRSWNHIQMFTTSIGAAAGHDRWADPADTGAALSARARAYLAANCAQCHLPGGPAPGSLDLTHGASRSGMNVIDVRPTQGSLGLADPWRVRPFDRAASVLFLRTTRLDGTRMPPLAHEAVDPDGSALLGSWIDSGAP
jgi:uncharacterized repeat protein (TIGR03806 family)